MGRQIYASFAVSVFMVLLVLPSALAISISPDSILINFEPGFAKEYEFRTAKQPGIGVSVEGALAQYVRVEEERIEEDGTFLIAVELPESIETPGDNVVYITLIEKEGSAGMVSAIASIRAPIVIRVPYPGRYADVSFYAPNMNDNESGYFTITIDNRGSSDITASAVIDIMDSSKMVRGQLIMPEKVVRKSDRAAIGGWLNASAYAPGPYTARAEARIGDETKKMEQRFTIGTLQVDIVNYTDSYLAWTTNKMSIDILSRWNTPLRNVYAEVTFLNGTISLSTFTTPSIEVLPLDAARLSSFWDATGIGPGQYGMEVTVFYDDRTTKKKGPAAVRVLEAPKASVLGGLLGGASPLVLGLVALVVVLIILNFIVLLKRR